MKRMNSGLVGLLALAATLALPAATAPAQTSTLFAFGAPGAKILAQSDVPLHIRGELAVSFHGDAASGCATYGLCAYSGTIVVRPRIGDLVTLSERVHGRIRDVTSFFLAPRDNENEYLTVANVQRSIAGQPSGTCADGETSGMTSPSTGVRGGALTIMLLGPGGSLLSTRCAGPLDADLAGASPQATISERVARRGRTTIDLTGVHAFAAHGFAGMVSSTLVVSLGKPARVPSKVVFPSGIKTHRVRTVIEHLSLVRVAGSLRATVAGATDPLVCRLLDSCGLTGTLNLDQAPRDAVGEVIATGPATRPYADFLAALGRGRGGDARGIPVVVAVYWSAGSITADIAQAGVCTDTAPLNDISVSLTPHQGALRGTGSSGPWRTRCPGPEIGGDEGNTLLTASAPAGAVRHRTFTIRVRPVGSIAEDGYTGSLEGGLSVVVRAGRVTQTVSLEPAP